VIPFDADKKKRKRKGVIKLHNRAGTYSLKLRAERLEIEKRVKDLEKGKKWMKDDVVAL
jgi:ribosome recycling factor